MRTLLLAICFAMLVAAAPLNLAAQQVVFVVRHGEKLDNTPDTVLSVEGEARAQRLAKMLATSGVRAIYTTQYQRTILLAAPTAKRFGISSLVVPAKETETLLAKIRAHGKDEAVLVVGHSNTVPAILKGLGHAPALVIAEEEFDNFFVVIPQAAGPPVVVRLKY